MKQMSGNRAMAHEGEIIERAALEAVHSVLDPELAAELKADLVPVGDGVASIAGRLPASAITINRVIGLGLDRPVRRQDVAQARALYDEAGAGRFFLQIHPEARNEALLAACAEFGLEKARGWQKFSRDPDTPILETNTAFTVHEVGRDQGEAFARIVCDAFDLGEAAIPWLARLPGQGEWRAFMAFEGDTPAGAGALFMKDGVGFTDFGATAPAFRGRGAQNANLAHRLRVARDAGCRRIYTCTGEEVPGDPQHSFRNIKKLGFSEDYVRENYAPPKR